MLKPEHRRVIDELWDRLSDRERAALGAYVHERVESLTSAANDAPVMHIYYATETGNTKSVASQLEKQAKARGYRTKNLAIGKVKPQELAALQGPAIFLASTHGEGDPPEMARKFFTALAEAKDLRLPTMPYAVLGLGDKSYQHFCKMGEVLDAAFSTAGASRFHTTLLLDVDYTQHVPGWITAVLESLGKIVHVAPRAHASVKDAEPEIESTRGFTRLEPLVGTIKDIINLNDRGSVKETFHIELAFDDALAYKPGDSAGIILPPANDGTVPAPRLYSIASSPLSFRQEVHLTVAHATYKKEDGGTGYGLCSHFLAQKSVGDRLEFYIQRNNRFRVPEDDATDVIMIGPGTGVAPFRAFLQERNERGASGRNWLFFGDQHAHCDFLYQLEWQEWLDNGVLTRLDSAFSRDQKNKIYVQNRMREQARELYAWIEGGATIYVCGSKSPMSEDVDTMLAEIIASEGKRDAAAARERLEQMMEDDRYLKDVY